MACALMMLVCAHSGATAEDNGYLKVILVEAESHHPIVRRAVTLWGNDRIECFRAPCPTRVSIHWKGRTNWHGVVMIPRREAAPPSSLEVDGYQRQNIDADPRFPSLLVQLVKAPRY